MSFGKTKQASSSVCLGKRTSSAGSPGSTAVRAGLRNCSSECILREWGIRLREDQLEKKSLGPDRTQELWSPVGAS